ncbi:MAG: phosphodiester glycosidase family protein [Sphingomonadaceae bacterium]
MKKLIIILPLAIAACNPQPEGKPVQRYELDPPGKAAQADDPVAEPTPIATPTPAAESACERVTFEGAALTHCVADPAKHQIAMKLGPEGGAPWRGFSGLKASLPPETSVAFAVNGGMFNGEGKPIGYYVEASQRLKELNRNDGPGNFHLKPNGVFYGSGGSWRIRTSDDFFAKVGDRPQFGTQSGPMLVIDGKLHPEITDDGPSKAIRNGVGVDAKGRAHFVISEEPLSFGKIARYFRDELKTPNALFLDGNVSALWDPASDRMDSRAPIGPLIVVTKKD